MTPSPKKLAAAWPVGSVAAAWTSSTGERMGFGPTDRLYALASVTKPLVALAILIASEEGTLPLDSALGPDGSTVAHVLAHASGLQPSASVPPVDAGTRRIYSNAGFDLLGMALERAAKMTTADYLHEAVCEPLGMTSTRLDGSPAHAAISTVDDLMRFGAELLTPTLIDESTHRRATTPFLGHLSGVLPGFGRQDPNPWGLGFEIRGTKSPHWTDADAPPETFGHFGAAGTFLWVDPVGQRYAVCLTDTPFGPWAGEAWPAFNAAIRQS